MTFNQLENTLPQILKDKLEDARISIRKAREEAQSELKDAKLPEDDLFRAKDELQKIVDDFNAQLETLFAKKEQEVLNQ